MPKQERIFTLDGFEREKILAISYSVFGSLNWPVMFAGEDKLLGNTPKTWKTNSQQIIVGASDNEFMVSSEMVHGESFDATGKNTKNIETFRSAFDELKNNLSLQVLEDNIKSINTLRANTSIKVEEEQREAEEVNKAMNIYGNNLYATYGIIAANCIVFILMALDGAGIFNANGLVHLKWGSNFAPLTLSGDWWRLISNIFIHFGIFHLAMNMYTLYMAGIYLEPMLGKLKFIAAYFCTGVLASLASLWWHTEPVNSAGASGAIFGMYGLFLALLTTSIVPKKVRDTLLKSIGIFVIYNLAFGMQGGIDNSAHIGGLVSGLLIGYTYTFSIKKEQQKQQAVSWIIFVIIIVSAAVTYSYLSTHISSEETRAKVLAELKANDFKDTELFNEKYNAFVELQDKALAVYNDTTLSDAAKRDQLMEKSLPYWSKAELLAQEMQSLDVSPEFLQKGLVVKEYIELRKKELFVMQQILSGNNSDSVNSNLQVLNNSINRKVSEMNSWFK